MAEVLITLGIIGVVAAMTIPTLMAQHRKQVVETRLAKYYSTMNQALRRAEVDHGSMIDWESFKSYNGFEVDENGDIDYNSPKPLTWFNKYLKPYLNCVDIKYSKSLEGRIVCYFADGSVTLISGSSWLYFPNAKDYQETPREQADGMRFSREYGGTKLFTFDFVPSRGGMLTYGYQFDDNRLRSDATVGCKPDIADKERAFCSTLIMRNGWKIPKDYPLKF